MQKVNFSGYREMEFNNQSCLIMPKISAIELKQFRKDLGLTQKEFSDFYGINIRTLKRWEGDDVQSPRFTQEFQRVVMDFVLKYAKTRGG